MTKLDDIEKAITRLSPEELAKLRAWLEDFDARVFDEKIERDAKSGKLDKLAAEALADHKAGRSRELSVDHPTYVIPAPLVSEARERD